MQFGVLGPLAVWQDGRELDLGAAKQRALLAVLLLHAGETMTRERLVDALWGERPPATAVKALQVYVSKVRKLLDEGMLETRPGGYVLRLDGETLDSQRFEAMLERGRTLLASGAAEDAVDLLREALELWRGPALADLQYEGFARDEIGRLEELRLVAFGLRVEADLALGRAAEVVPELEALVREHPLRERLRELLILALYRAGRQADALATYQDARTVLLDELGLDPGEALKQLEKAILQHDPSLDVTAASTADLPTGTVTFLFTDIESSTEVLTRLGPRDYARLLDEHRRLLRATFTDAGGREVDTQGDAFFVAFPTAVGAIQSAVSAQRETVATELRIRIGIHTGEPSIGPTGYVGLDVPRAARICAAGHGGQVLISQATRELVENELPEGVELRDLGNHRFKDFERPQRLSQLVIEGLPPEFPALRTAYRTNLPVPPTDFLGREQELAELTELLRDSVRLLTLAGPGGAGKTRLALQAAAVLTAQFPDGVWWVRLAPLHDPTLLLVEVARVLDISQPGRELAEVVADALAGKRMLIVLDNAEHLLPDAAASVALLRDTAGPTLLVTSRERLQLAGEHVYQVPPLAAADGLALFRARARTVGATFEGREAAEELCSRLDFLPLALELAAARTALLSPEQILQRLPQRLDLLRAGRDVDPRQQTLRSTIEWSYDLLNPGERELFARLSVFAGGCTLEAAEQVCDAELDNLAALVDKSLLRLVDGRYWMLETIRQHAAERLGESGEEDALLRRHMGFYDGFAAEAKLGMHSSDVGAWLDRVEQELPNLREAMEFSLGGDEPAAAVRMSAALGWFWGGRSPTEGRTWVERALATGAGTTAERGKAALIAAYRAWTLGDPERSFVVVQESIDLAGESGDDETLAAALAHYVGELCERGDVEAAVALIPRCKELASRAVEPRARADAIDALAAISWGTGDIAQSNVLIQDVLALRREAGDEMRVAGALSSIAYGAMATGSYDVARTSLEESLEIARRLRHATQITFALGNGGLVAVLEERYDDAIALLEEDLRLCSARGDRRVGGEAILGLATAHAALGNFELAVKLEAIANALYYDATKRADPVLDRLEPHLRAARERADPAVVAAFVRDRQALTMDAAIAELERYTSSATAR